MKQKEDRTTVYEAVCQKMTLIGDTPYLFCDRIAGTEEKKMISHTKTLSTQIRGFDIGLKSSFTVDKEPVWNMLQEQGYGFHLYAKLQGVGYEVTWQGQQVGVIKQAGTGAMNPKYENSPMGKIPAKGIYSITCEEEHIPAIFMLCFAVARTDLSLERV